MRYYLGVECSEYPEEILVYFLSLLITVETCCKSNAVNLSGNTCVFSVNIYQPHVSLVDTMYGTTSNPQTQIQLHSHLFCITSYISIYHKQLQQAIYLSQLITPSHFPQTSLKMKVVLPYRKSSHTPLWDLMSTRILS